MKERGCAAANGLVVAAVGLEDLANSDGTSALTTTRKGIGYRALPNYPKRPDLPMSARCYRTHP